MASGETGRRLFLLAGLFRFNWTALQGAVRLHNRELRAFWVASTGDLLDRK